MEQKLSTDIQENMEAFEALYKNCDDIIRRPMRLGREVKVDCVVVYIEVAVSNMMLEESVLGKLINRMWDMPAEEIYRYIEDNGVGISDVSELAAMEDVTAALLSGNAVLFVDGYDKAIKIGSKGYPGMGVMEAESEKTARGSKEAFTDSVKTNAALIRKRIRDPRVKAKELFIGTRSNTLAYIVYMEDLVYPNLLETIEGRLAGFEIDGVLDSGVVEQLAEKRWYSPFPQFQVTERPDRAGMAILDGRAALLFDNSPSALLLPATYNSFIQTSDDYFNRWEIASFDRLLRYIASFLAMALPGLYLALTNFHTQIIPTDLILSFAAAREGVPFPGVVEVLLMELAFELLREAGIRIPGAMGSTIGIVGGLIIGQAAVEANLVSPIVVIVVALTALCSFTIPNEEFATAFRLIKFGLILAGAFLGFYGFLLGVLFVLIHLAHLKSFQIPYLTPFTGADLNGNADTGDALIRLPLFLLKKRPVFARREQRVRLRDGLEENGNKPG